MKPLHGVALVIVSTAKLKMNLLCLCPPEVIAPLCLISPAPKHMMVDLKILSSVTKIADDANSFRGTHCTFCMAKQGNIVVNKGKISHV